MCVCARTRANSLISACGINKCCDERGQLSVAVVMEQWSVAMRGCKDGEQLYRHIVLRTQMADGDVFGLRQAKTDGSADRQMEGMIKEESAKQKKDERRVDRCIAENTFARQNRSLSA